MRLGGQRYSLAVPPGEDFICEEIFWLVFVDISSFCFDQTLFTATPVACAYKVSTFKT
jgi:hypothetical protein